MRLQLRGPLLNGLQRSKRLILVGSSKREQRDQFATLGRLSAAESHTAAVTPLIMQSSTVVARTERRVCSKLLKKGNRQRGSYQSGCARALFTPHRIVVSLTENSTTGRTLADHLMTTAVSWSGQSPTAQHGLTIACQVNACQDSSLHVTAQLKTSLHIMGRCCTASHSVLPHLLRHEIHTTRQ